MGSKYSNQFSYLLRLLPQFRQQRCSALGNFVDSILFNADIEIDQRHILMQHALWRAAVGDLSDAVANHFTQKKNRSVPVTGIFQRNVALDLAVKAPVVQFSFPFFSLIQIRAVISALAWFSG